MSAKRAAFFFGSGISFRSGGPTVDTISDKLLNGSWADHSDWRFNPANGRSSDAAKRIQQFLHILKAHIDPHLRSHDDRESNYEDLYAAALQIVQDETCEIVNPLLAATVRIIRDATKDLYQHLPPHIDNNRFASLADRASDLIQWVVYHTIARAKRPSGLEPLAAMARATASMNIFSLNHDLLIERQLDADMIPFSDGFSEVDGDVVRFNWSWNEKVPLRLYKLHGSVDWYRFRFPA